MDATTQDPPRPQRVLALDLGDVLAPLIPVDALVTQAQIVQLDAALLAQAQPDQIVVPLFSGVHDALQVIEDLEILGYRGTILVIGPRLPNPRLVERELRNAGPGLRLVLVTP